MTLLPVIKRPYLLPFILFLLPQCSTRENAVYQPKRSFSEYQALASEARKYCVNNNLNTSFFLLADLSVHSGIKRLFIWDFARDTITDKFLVSHGCCRNPWSGDDTKSDPEVSNIPDSHCSSVGKYIIGQRGYSNWGVRVKYLLHGLEPTNSNAQRREIVFHSWEKISDAETYPEGSPESWGCPAVSNNAFRKIDARLRPAGKTLLWIIK